MDFGAISFASSEAPGKPDEYRRYAAECRELARGVYNEGSRQELLDLADIWLSLAETRQG